MLPLSNKALIVADSDFEKNVVENRKDGIIVGLMAL